MRGEKQTSPDVELKPCLHVQPDRVDAARIELNALPLKLMPAASAA